MTLREKLSAFSLILWSLSFLNSYVYKLFFRSCFFCCLFWFFFLTAFFFHIVLFDLRVFLGCGFCWLFFFSVFFFDLGKLMLHTFSFLPFLKVTEDSLVFSLLFILRKKQTKINHRTQQTKKKGFFFKNLLWFCYYYSIIILMINISLYYNALNLKASSLAFVHFYMFFYFSNTPFSSIFCISHVFWSFHWKVEQICWAFSFAEWFVFFKDNIVSLPFL